MLLRFFKDWTLPVAIVIGVSIYLLFHYVEVLQPVAQWYAPHNNAVLPDFMFLILFVTFCKVDFKKLLPVPWHLWVGVAQLLFVGAIMAVVLLFDLSLQWLIAVESVLVCVICPCASAAPVVTAKLNGRLEEMTAYTFLSNFYSALLIPLCFPLFPNADGSPADISFLPVFFKILWKVSVVLIGPMVAAFVVKHALPGLHRRIIAVKDLSYYLWAASLTVVSGTTAMNILDARHFTTTGFILAIGMGGLVLCILQFAMGRVIGAHFDRRVECGQGLFQKNTTFAIWAATAFLNPLASVGPGCYILWQNIINSIEIWQEEKKGRATTS